MLRRRRFLIGKGSVAPIPEVADVPSLQPEEQSRFEESEYASYDAILLDVPEGEAILQIINEGEDVEQNDLGGFEKPTSEKGSHGIENFMEEMHEGLKDEDNKEFDNEYPQKEKKDGNLIEKFKAMPLWLKASIAIVVVALFLAKDEFIGKDAPAPELTEVDVAADKQIAEKPVAEKTPTEARLEKLNACLTASSISFKFQGGILIPFFGDQDVSSGVAFCDDFTLKNYKLDPSNNNLSVVGEIYAGADVVKRISVDPLAYFKPTYYLEGIGFRHPSTGVESVYMPGDQILTSDGTKLSLESATISGDKASVVYGFILNGTKTSITIPRNLVQ